MYEKYLHMITNHKTNVPRRYYEEKLFSSESDFSYTLQGSILKRNTTTIAYNK